MKLTEHFTWREANPRNAPLDADLVRNIQDTAERMEAVRDLLGGGPIVVNSWYRSHDHNRQVGGSATSDHRQGLALDFRRQGWTVTDTYRFLVRLVRTGQVECDQLIKYETHIHIGFGPRMRAQVWAEE